MTPAYELVAVVVGIVTIGYLGYLIWYLLTSRQFIVEPNRRERLVVQNMFTGDYQVLKPGTHFYPLWWKELERVDLNREQVAIPDEMFRSSDGALVLLSYRYDIVAGRHFRLDHGQLADPKNNQVITDPDNETYVTPRAVVLAVTRIDFPERRDRVKEIVAGAVEDVLGAYQLKNMTHFEGDGRVIPELRLEGNPTMAPVGVDADYVLPAVLVRNSAEFYRAISARIEALANKELTFVGLNICGVKITNLRPENAATQDSIEKPLRAPWERAHAEKLIADRNDITYREALVAEHPEAYGVVATAQAKRDAADSFSRAIQNAGDAARDGLRNFSRG